MNSAEMLDKLPGFFEQYIDGTSPEWILPSVGGLNAGMWRFRIVDMPGPSVGIKVLGNEAHELRVNVGLVLGARYTPQLAEYVNMLNNKQLIFGRVFIVGNVPFVADPIQGPCAVVMQEIVFGPSLSFDFPPSLNHVLNMTARLAGQGGRALPDLVDRFGGRPFDDDTEGAAVLMMF